MECTLTGKRNLIIMMHANSILSLESNDHDQISMIMSVSFNNYSDCNQIIMISRHLPNFLFYLV